MPWMLASGCSVLRWICSASAATSGSPLLRLQSGPGLTERTFFRHFADKREALFGGEAILREALAASIAEAPRGLPPLAVLFRSFRSVEALLEGNRHIAVPRQEILDSTPALQERELAKHAALADALAAALRARGVAALPAELAARTGMSAFVHATLLWLRDPTWSLAKRLARVESELMALLSQTHSRTKR